jgi:hypothetical protein
MAKENPTGASGTRALDTYEEDEHQQWAVLRVILELHPTTTLTQDELIRKFSGGGSKEFTDVDPVERAVRELAGDGLLHRPGEDELVRPTWAALRYFELSGGAG